MSASQAGVPIHSLMYSDKNNWSPRLGLAIRPFGDATTVVRLGYGVYTQMWPGLMALKETGGPWHPPKPSSWSNATDPSIDFPTPSLRPRISRDCRALQA